jgi:hypothetical protein
MIVHNLDMGVYRGHSQRTEVLTPLIENHLTPKLIDKSHITALVLLMLVLLQMAIPVPAIANSYSVDVLRVYAHSRIINYKEFKCFDRIVVMESGYNYLARNGSHMGIGQMRSKYYQSKDPFTQIDLTIIYIHKRYITICNALAFHNKHGYY